VGERTQRWRNLRDLISLFRAANASGPDNPGSVSSDDESAAVFQRATALAVGDTDDRTARDDLIQMAGGRRQTLERAEKMSRLGRRHLESGRGYNTHRLLAAALRQEEVVPASEEVLAQIKALNQFFARGRPDEEVWDELCRVEPRLLDLLADARSGRFGPAREAPFTTPTTPEEERRVLESSHGALGLTAELKHLVGSVSARDDPILGSERALTFADRYLGDQRPTT
jgi:hypothetical protein